MRDPVPTPPAVVVVEDDDLYYRLYRQCAEQVAEVCRVIGHYAARDAAGTNPQVAELLGALCDAVEADEEFRAVLALRGRWWR
jgi:hypothetical protein